MATATAPVDDMPIVNPPAPKRLVSVDAYRGFVMLLMMGEVLSFKHVSESLPGNGFWKFMYFNQDHVAWAGLSLHDMIQPSFTFLVGVALPFSIAGRLAKGAKFGGLLKHAITRSIILVVLGILIRSLWTKQTNFTFEDTLSQIGMGYTFVFLLAFCKQRTQIIALVVILVGYWLAFALYPLPGPDFDYTGTAVSPAWEGNFQGFAAHWNKNTHLAWAFDRWFMNLFPREAFYYAHEGGYCTLNFIPTMGTMILGLLAGNILRADIPPMIRVRRFVIIGAALFILGAILHFTGINPIVKRIFTPAFVIFSGGICFIYLAIFYRIIDIGQHKKWAFFLVVVGMNSIFAFCMSDALSGWFGNTLYVHLGQNFDQLFGDAYSTLVKGGLVLLIEWSILYWMYKNKVFIKI